MIIYKGKPIKASEITADIIKDIAYGKYIHNWIEAQGYSLLDVLEIIEHIFAINDIENPGTEITIKEAYEIFLYEEGFHGNIYDTFTEFLDNEFHNVKFMKDLLTHDEYTAYISTIVDINHQKGMYDEH